MIGGRQNMQEEKEGEEDANPEKEMEVDVKKLVENEKKENKNLLEPFREVDKQVQQIIYTSVSNQVLGENEANPINEQEESRPSPPIEESFSQSQSNLKQAKTKSLPLSNQLLRLIKKSTTNLRERKQPQKKVRCFITDFQPYLPTFLDQIHRQHHKNIIRIGQNYQARISSQPEFESLHRPMDHLRIWKGSEEKLNKDALKKFRQIYGENRTEEDLILLKHRLQSESWSDLMKEITAQKQAGKKSSLVIANNSILGATTRNK